MKTLQLKTIRCKNLPKCFSGQNNNALSSEHQLHQAKIGKYECSESIATYKMDENNNI